MLEGEGEKREVDEGKHVIADPPGHGAEPRALTSNKDDCWKRHARASPPPAPAPAPARTIFDSIRLLHRAPDALVLETEATQRCRVEHVPAVHEETVTHSRRRLGPVELAQLRPLGHDHCGVRSGERVERTFGDVHTVE